MYGKATYILTSSTNANFVARSSQLSMPGNEYQRALQANNCLIFFASDPPIYQVYLQ